MISQTKRRPAPQVVTPEPGPSKVEVWSEKIRTAATSAVTVIGLAAFVVASILPELTELLGADHPAVTLGGQALVVMGAVITIIRRVSPAPRSTWGLTPVTEDRLGLVSVVTTGKFQHGGYVYEAGQVYEVPATDAGYFIGVGWAALAQTRIQPDDMTIHSSTEVV